MSTASRTSQRGTGLRPQRPAGWERRPGVPMDGKQAEGPQGPSELRSVGTPQGSFPSEVVNTLAASPGGFMTQILAGRPGLEAEKARPGDSSNLGGTGGLPGNNLGGKGNHIVKGSASPHVTKGQF
jgi:hypothetical protein